MPDPTLATPAQQLERLNQWVGLLNSERDLRPLDSVAMMAALKAASDSYDVAPGQPRLDGGPS